MTTPAHATPERSYGCSFGCGNPYDYILVSVADGSIEFLCMPCYVRLAHDMIAAVVDPSNPEVASALNAIGTLDFDPAPGPRGRPRGHNAPAGYDDDGITDAFDSVITVDDLPEEFR